MNNPARTDLPSQTDVLVPSIMLTSVSILSRWMIRPGGKNLLSSLPWVLLSVTIQSLPTLAVLAATSSSSSCVNFFATSSSSASASRFPRLRFAALSAIGVGIGVLGLSAFGPEPRRSLHLVYSMSLRLARDLATAATIAAGNSRENIRDTFMIYIYKMMGSSPLRGLNSLSRILYDVDSKPSKKCDHPQYCVYCCCHRLQILLV